jgi:hypothetical protein
MLQVVLWQPMIYSSLSTMQSELGPVKLAKNSYNTTLTDYASKEFRFLQ